MRQKATLDLNTLVNHCLSHESCIKGAVIKLLRESQVLASCSAHRFVSTFCQSKSPRDGSNCLRHPIATTRFATLFDNFSNVLLHLAPFAPLEWVPIVSRWCVACRQRFHCSVMQSLSALGGASTVRYVRCTFSANGCQLQINANFLATDILQFERAQHIQSNPSWLQNEPKL